MSETPKGTGDAGASPGRYFLIREAECSEDDSSEDGADLEQLFDAESETGIFIDDTDLDQGTSAELYHQQETEESERQTQVLKRKFLASPKQSTPDRTCKKEAELELSPIFQACSITPSKENKAKKKIRFADREDEARSSAPANAVEPEVGVSEVLERQAGDGASNESDNAPVQDEVDRAAPQELPELPDISGVELMSRLNSSRCKGFDQKSFVEKLLKTQNVRAKILYKVKEGFAVPLSELCRVFKSNKTCSTDWVICTVGVREDIVNAAHEQLQQHCQFVYTRMSWAGEAPLCLQLLRFNGQKNRDSLHNLYKSLMLVDEVQLVSNPPRTTSTAAALYWYKGASSNLTAIHGDMLDWIINQTDLEHKLGAETPFELSKMVQWAYDNEVTDESQIALGYALLAEEDDNAQAFLKSNSQAKYVKDCAQMVRLYRRGEMMRMTMGQWIYHRSSKIDDDPEGWRNIVRFLRHQAVEIIPFLIAFKSLLHGVPKKNCIAIEGPPNTGKSLFAMSLVGFLGGKVITFANSKSHFWLQPLSEAKIGLIDDCTLPFWTYCDTYLRNGLDGNQLCIDCKHRTPVQLKFPPMIITTNVYINDDPRWSYLTSRVKTIRFPTVLNRVDGTAFKLKAEDWKSFFQKFQTHLDLPLNDGSEDGPAHGSLRITPRRDL